MPMLKVLIAFLVFVAVTAIAVVVQTSAGLQFHFIFPRSLGIGLAVGALVLGLMFLPYLWK